ncbi:hypothetical protein RJ918_36950, partial [Pseudomonas aeruginosa]|uniref:hypothetical protein n=1 Tax=Pseudomonas aeruginosa TaxID=287 RepID=UPI003014C823
LSFFVFFRTPGLRRIISAMDFYPTALDAADISIPKDLKLDGVSLLPWLQDKKQGEPHKNLTWITSYSHWFKLDRSHVVL